MAISSYPHKGMDVLKAAFFEKRSIGDIDLYQDVSKSVYKYVDTSDFQFATMPGMIAFLYYSDSWLIVFLGMMLTVFLLVSFEYIVMKLTDNPIICSLLGFSSANVIAQFGVCPSQMVPYFIMIFIAVVFIALIQSIKVSSIQEKNQSK